MTISTSQMQWNPEGKSLTGEASTLNFQPKPVIGVKSHRTGATVMFKLERVKRDSENDILYWRYRPVTDVKVSHLLIFND